MGSPYLDIGTGLAPLLAGCGKTIVARENFEGLHVWRNWRSLPQDAQRPPSKAAASEGSKRTLWGTLRG